MAESKLVIEGGHPLRGELTVQGAKNSVLPLLCSAMEISYWSGAPLCQMCMLQAGS